MTLRAKFWLRKKGGGWAASDQESALRKSCLEIACIDQRLGDAVGVASPRPGQPGREQCSFGFRKAACMVIAPQGDRARDVRRGHRGAALDRVAAVLVE